jgi:hypothetical protein
MTPTELETAARQRYNAVGDNFWSQAEIFTLIYKAQMELASKTFCLPQRYTTTSTAGTDELSVPTLAIAIRRIYYNNAALEPISMEERELILGPNDPSTVTGTPDSYCVEGQTIFLVKTPSASSVTIKIWTFDEPNTVTVTSTLDVPTRYHPAIIDFIVFNMYSKDKRFDLAKWHKDMWDQAVNEAIILEKRRRRADKLPTQSLDTNYRGIRF